MCTIPRRVKVIKPGLGLGRGARGWGRRQEWVVPVYLAQTFSFIRRKEFGKWMMQQLHNDVNILNANELYTKNV